MIDIDVVGAQAFQAGFERRHDGFCLEGLSAVAGLLRGQHDAITRHVAQRESNDLFGAVALHRQIGSKHRD